MRRQEESLGIAKETNMLNQSFTALLIRNPTPGGWTCVIWLKSAAFFETHKLVKVKGTIDGCPFRSAFMALEDGNYKSPVKAEILRAIGKSIVETIRVAGGRNQSGPQIDKPKLSRR